MNDYLIYDGAIKIADDALWYKMQNEAAFFKYDYNYFAFKQMPSFSVFKSIEKAMHNLRNNEAIKIRFPKNTPLPQEIKQYLQSMKYELSKMQVYKMMTDDFSCQQNEQVHVEKVNEKNYADYADLLYANNVTFGATFAKQNGAYTKNYKFAHPEKFEFYLAYVKDVPVGSLDIIKHTKTCIELDSFVVLQSYQRQGVGVALQSKVMQNHPGKEIFLVADGEDTPKDMYAKQGYQLQFEWYEALLIVE